MRALRVCGVLSEAQLRYWRTEADYHMGKPGSLPIQLGGYEVSTAAAAMSVATAASTFEHPALCA